MNAEERVALAFVAEHPLHAARLLERAEPADAAAILTSVEPAIAAEVFRAFGPSPAAACAAALSDESLAGIVLALPLDAAGNALRHLETSRRDAVLRLLPEARREQLHELLAYPESTAGALADPLVLALTDDMTVADAVEQLRGSQRHLFYYLYVVARDRRLVGVLAMPELMAARPSDTLAAVMRTNLVHIEAHADVATVAVHPAWRDFDALPVVNSDGRLIGAIRHKTIRQMSWDRERPLMATIVGLSELYWAGLSGILASFAPTQVSAREADNVP